MENKEQKSPAGNAGQDVFDTSGDVKNNAKIVQNIDTHKKSGSKVPLGAIGMPRRVLINQNTTKGQSANDFPPSAEDLKEFPLWGLPQELQDVINDVADGYWCTPTIPAVAMLAAACAAIGNKAEATIENHENYPTIWPIIVGMKSVGKSDPAYFFFKAFEEYDQALEDEFNTALSKWLEAKKQGKEPRLKQLTMQGLTDEALLKYLADNNGVGCLYLDEFKTLAGSWGRYAKNGNEQIFGYLESIYSQKPTKVATIGRGLMRIPRPALTMFSTTQPRVYENIMKPILNDDGGLFERFSPVFVERRKEKKKKHTIENKSVKEWQRLVKRLLSMNKTVLTEHESATEWRTKAECYWENMAESAEEDSGQLADTQCALYRKATYTLYRVAIVVAVIRGEDIITAPAMRYAAEVTQFFLNNQLVAAIKLLLKDEIASNKKAVYRWLAAHKDQLRVVSKKGELIPPTLSQLAAFLGESRQAFNYLIHN